MRIYEIQMEDGSTVYAEGSDKNEAWAKVGFAGYMVDSYPVEEWDAMWMPSEPEVL